MKHKGEKPLPMDQIPDDAKYAARQLERWLFKNRWVRGVPEEGYNPWELSACTTGCTIHDHKK